MRVVTNKKELNEYRCKGCNKLLSRGILHCEEDYLEVKCRNCKRVCVYRGRDADQIKAQSADVKKKPTADKKSKVGSV